VGAGKVVGGLAGLAGFRRGRPGRPAAVARAAQGGVAGPLVGIGATATAEFLRLDAAARWTRMSGGLQRGRSRSVGKKKRGGAPAASSSSPRRFA